jgi:very-short-patch-repair endonuclease
MEDKLDTVDRRIDEVAARQHGVIALRQLEEVGLGRRGVSKRTSTGRLHRVHRAVYAVGHRGLSLHGRWMAAVLACGKGAVLSHGSAAVLWKLLRPLDGPSHVSIPVTTGRKPQRGITLHRCPSLAEPSPLPSYLPSGGGRGRRLTTHRDHIPVTTVQRTIEDLPGHLPSRLVRRAIRQAEMMGFRLDGIESDRTRSDLESFFLALCRRHGLPPPEVNVKLGHWEVDFLWRAQRLIVETDSFAYHRGSIAFQDDHARDLDLRQQGFAVRRFSERQLEEEPARVIANVRAALTAAASARL